MKWYLEAFKNYANFSGRARRKAYWMFQLFNFLVVLVLEILAFATMETAGMAFFVLMGIYGVAILIPTLALTIRRLHDTGKSGWYIFMGLIPLVGGIILLVYYCSDSQPGANKYGPNPKEAEYITPSANV